MHRRFGASFAALIVVGAMFGTTAGAQPAKPAAPAPAAATEAVFTGPDKLMSTLSSRLATAAEADSFAVIVQFTAAANPAAYQAVETATGRLGYKAQWDAAVQGFAANLTKRQIKALQGLSVIKQVDLDQPVHMTLDTSTQYTGVQKARADYGIDGSRGFACCSANNVVAAVIDTGIDAAHVDLQGKVIGWVDYVNGMTTPYDDQGHGSHVSGIIAGKGAGNAAYKGNAPGAALVGIKVLNSAGSGTTANIISGINWMISHKATYNIKVANMSLGASGCSNGTDSLSAAVNSAVASGIVMVVAAGNSGPATCTIASPAAAANAITVGASVDPGLNAAKGGWALANFSSRGPTLDGRIKPEVIAPGYKIKSVKANSTNGYVAMSGTSMAAPQVAGIVALMYSANNSLTPAQVKSYLTANVVDWGVAGLDKDYGYGLVKAHAAIKAAGGYTTGSYSDGTSHRYVGGFLLAGAANSYTISVTSTSRPIGLTLLMQGCTCDFDLYLYKPGGIQVATSLGTNRQEQVMFLPTVTGTYTIKVLSYSGSGVFDLDISWK